MKIRVQISMKCAWKYYIYVCTFFILCTCFVHKLITFLAQQELQQIRPVYGPRQGQTNLAVVYLLIYAIPRSAAFQQSRIDNKEVKGKLLQNTSQFPQNSWHIALSLSRESRQTLNPWIIKYLTDIVYVPVVSNGKSIMHLCMYMATYMCIYVLTLSI